MTAQTAKAYALEATRIYWELAIARKLLDTAIRRHHHYNAAYYRSELQAAQLRATALLKRAAES